VNNLVRVLPVGTAYFIGLVLVTMLTGQLVHPQGSLARAVLPYVLHLRWGWHRIERTMARGKVSVDVLFERALTWCVESLPVAPIRVGSKQRTMQAIDTSTVARLRAHKTRCARLGKGYCHRAQRAVQANLVAALTSVVLIEGGRVGLVRRTRFGTTSQEAVAHLFADLPTSPEKRLFSVDAGIATVEQFHAATCAPLPMGPRDGKPARSAGRLANYLGLHVTHFVTLALQGVAPRTYRKFTTAQEQADSPLPLAA
jgi:hypothetical protein